MFSGGYFAPTYFPGAYFPRNVGATPPDTPPHTPSSGTRPVHAERVPDVVGVLALTSPVLRMLALGSATPADMVGVFMGLPMRALIGQLSADVAPPDAYEAELATARYWASVRDETH